MKLGKVVQLGTLVKNSDPEGHVTLTWVTNMQKLNLCAGENVNLTKVVQIVTTIKNNDLEGHLTSLLYNYS